MMIVEQGRVVDVCATPGEYIYDLSTEPSLFYGDLEEGILGVFQSIGKRFTFGGEPPKDQRVYFINTKELVGNKYGTPSPIPFRVVDSNIGLDVDISIKCFGEYSYRIANPILFYTNVCGNVNEDYKREKIDGQLKSELMTALQPVFAKISEMGIRYSALPGHTQELAEVLNQVLSEKWGGLRGIQIVSLGVSSVKASEEDEAMLKELQRNAAFRNPAMAAAHMVGSTGIGYAGGGCESECRPLPWRLQGCRWPPMRAGLTPRSFCHGTAAHACFCRTAAGLPTGGVCLLGLLLRHKNTGKFCSECGSPQPVGPWTCSCGSVNAGKFCPECGKPRP